MNDAGPIYFIADLHLESSDSGRTRLLLDFLSGPARQARALYILGDLFEVWIGDDAPRPPAASVSRALKTLQEQGVALYFMVGNRDFLLGQDFCEQAGLELIEEPCLIKHQQPSILLLHGDSLCTDDHDYQRFRRRVRDPHWQQRMLARPVWLRRVLAGLARLLSRRRNIGKPEAIMDVNPAAAVDTLRQHASLCLIHGHTHRPALHRLEVDAQPALRAVLGDWHDETACILQLDDQRLKLLELGRNGDRLTVKERDHQRLT